MMSGALLLITMLHPGIDCGANVKRKTEKRKRQIRFM
jgi:hypothetical protein